MARTLHHRYRGHNHPVFPYAPAVIPDLCSLTDARPTFTHAQSPIASCVYSLRGTNHSPRSQSTTRPISLSVNDFSGPYDGMRSLLSP